MGGKQEKNTNNEQIVETVPDETMTRYQVDAFKSTTKSKAVPFEQLDFSIYKQSNKKVAFATSEERIILWIRSLYKRYYMGLRDHEHIRVRWEEQQSFNDKTKCDRIVLHLTNIENNSNENVITFTIYVSTGRINVQGKAFQEWGKKEFEKMMAIINNKKPETTLETYTEDLQVFIDLLLCQRSCKHATSQTNATTNKQMNDDDKTVLKTNEKDNKTATKSLTDTKRLTNKLLAPTTLWKL